jgi:hypothetical protein
LLGHDQLLDHEPPLDIIGIHPILEWNVFIKLPNRSFIVSIEQIPIVLAFALTIDKCQELSLDYSYIHLDETWRKTKHYM